MIVEPYFEWAVSVGSSAVKCNSALNRRWDRGEPGHEAIDSWAATTARWPELGSVERWPLAAASTRYGVGTAVVLA